MKTSVSSYKGHPTISLDVDSRYPFSFGLAKAKMILASIEDIRRFVAEHDCDRVVETRFASGAVVTRNARGRCEDAPCCGCCT